MVLPVLLSNPGRLAPLVAQTMTIVACLGWSSTAGKGQAFDWIAVLKQKSRNERFRFLNFGVGGDLAYNALQRVPVVIECHPDKALVLVGGNDVLALVSRKVKRFFRIWKHLPCEPSPKWFQENVRAITRRLKTETSAAVGLCSLPLIGEDPISANPFQSAINRRIEEYSEIIKTVAQEEDVAYIPVYEVMHAQIMSSRGRAFTRFQFLVFYRDAFRVLILRKSPDEVAQLNGWGFHTDGVHLNSRGGMIVADLVQDFIDS
jgi:lysophospholipase L1-like esterase